MKTANIQCSNLGGRNNEKTSSGNVQNDTYSISRSIANNYGGIVFCGHARGGRRAGAYDGAEDNSDGQKIFIRNFIGIRRIGRNAYSGVYKLIYNSANRTAAQSNTTAADVADLKRDNAELRAENRKQYELIMRLMKKQDIFSNAVLTTFSLSELPRSLREQLHNAMTEYNGVSKAKEIVEQVAD